MKRKGKKDLWRNTKKSNIYVTWIPEGEKRNSGEHWDEGGRPQLSRTTTVLPFPEHISKSWVDSIALWTKSARPGFTLCVILGKLLYVSEPQFPCLNNGNSNTDTCSYGEAPMYSVSHRIFQQPYKVWSLWWPFFSWGNWSSEKGSAMKWVNCRAWENIPTRLSSLQAQWSPAQGSPGPPSLHASWLQVRSPCDHPQV